MFWYNPTKERKDPSAIKTYGIKPGSILDAPKYVILAGKNFEDVLNEYYRKQVSDTEMMVTMFSIFEIYRREGAVNIQSHLNKHLKPRHERVIIELLKENMDHLRQLENYFTSMKERKVS